MSLDAPTVEHALYELRANHKLALEVTTAGSRAAKYKQNMQAHWNFSPAKMAILCELFIRGPQTPGDLRAHATRLHPLADAREVEEILQGLANHSDGPFVVHLRCEPGKRERRWAHLFAGEPLPESGPAAELGIPEAETVKKDRIEALETEIAGLRGELDELKTAFDSFRARFE
jgi:uncharacterized protein YceH (UPF0502 family)